MNTLRITAGTAGINNSHRSENFKLVRIYNSHWCEPALKGWFWIIVRLVMKYRRQNLARARHRTAQNEYSSGKLAELCWRRSKRRFIIREKKKFVYKRVYISFSSVQKILQRMV